MARIPRHTMVAPRFSGIEAPEGAFMETSRALSNLVQTIGGSVELVQKHVYDAQAIRNRSDVNERVRKMREEHANFLLEIQKNGTDPAEWVPMWQSRLEGYRANLKEKGLPPVVVEEVTERFENFAGETMISLGGSALKENLRRGRETLQMNLQDRYENEDWGGATDEINQAEKDNLLDPVMAESLRRETVRKQTTAERQLALELDPMQYAKDIEDGVYGDLPPLKKQQELEKAEQWRARRERDKVSELQDAIKADLIATPEELAKNLEAAPEISKANAKLLMDGMKEEIPLTKEEKFGLADKMRDDFRAFKKGEIKLEEYIKRHDESRAKLDAYGSRDGTGPLKSLNYQMDPLHFIREGDEDPDGARKRAEKLKNTEERAKELVRQRAGGIRRISVAGRKEEDSLEPSSKGLAEVEAMERETEFLFRSRLEDRLIEWLDSFPEDKKPTETEMKAYLDKTQPEVVEELMNEAKAVEQEMIRKLNESKKGKTGKADAKGRRDDSALSARQAEILRWQDEFINDASPDLLPPIND